MLKINQAYTVLLSNRPKYI